MGPNRVVGSLTVRVLSPERGFLDGTGAYSMLS